MPPHHHSPAASSPPFSCSPHHHSPSPLCSHLTTTPSSPLLYTPIPIGHPTFDHVDPHASFSSQKQPLRTLSIDCKPSSITAPSPSHPLISSRSSQPRNPQSRCFKRHLERRDDALTTAPSTLLPPPKSALHLHLADPMMTVDS
ncbi:hypothetical protein EX30DRAFT_125857 [Ascodesmis nigricans]|uniref:Uncharacterized protein n=1 Tax=Ascodesmis nigricans TaxID=341454 RepID=A0A4S2MSK8_9PEZI|nr:hypothetical protein EX30DRAFT_125857 [Ascodesmis nigricans]